MQLQRFTLGEIGDAEAITVEQHLTQCMRCVDVLQRLPGHDELIERIMRLRLDPSHRMQPGTKLALTIAAVAIATGLTIKAVRAASRRKAESP